MTSTPPRTTSLRVRTPPTPLHGPQYDTYEPYSPRRSKRSTAQSNPYSSFNGERSPNSQPQHTTTPPTTTVKRARFARPRAPTQLSSPPSSPASPVKRQTLQHQHQHKTPRKQSHKAGVYSDSDGPSNSATLAPPTIDPVTMLPTPSKTPNKKRPATTTGRILNFQPNHPNDVMPSPRKINKIKRQRLHHQHGGMAGFELYDEDDDANSGAKGNEGIEIYTDANARVPELDMSEDNPFVGRRKKDGPPRPQQRRRRERKAPGEKEEEERMKDAVARDEGVVYVFRGKKIFRRFEEDEAEEAVTANDDATSPDLSATPAQRCLKRQAGAAAQRPLTRSAIKPRLLFPSEEQRLERSTGADDDVDEEAVTDIEISHSNTHALTSSSSAKSKPSQDEDLITPVEDSFNTVISTPPPSTNRNRSTKGRGKGKRSAGVELDSSPAQFPSASEDDKDVVSSAAVHSPDIGVGKRIKTKNPFDSWQRTKASAGTGSGSGAGRKRERAAGGEVEEGASGGGKRTRGNGIGSPD